MPRVNSDILRWARETAGLTQDEAVEKLQLRPARGFTAISRLEALESGVEAPTRPMLVRMAKQYRRPILTFYMSGVPLRGDRGQDFRTLPEGRSTSEDALLDALIRDVRARQSMVRAVLIDEEEAEPLPFVGSKAMSDGIPDVLSSIRETLAVNLSDLRSQPSQEGVFALLRDSAEKAGVFVLLMGNLGSHHSAISLQTFRGLALADDVAPFVVVNDQDSKAAWSFTLLHELTHLWLGQTGVSGGRVELAIEKFCNDVASRFLLTDEELSEISLMGEPNVETIQARVSEFAEARNLSKAMVSYRLFRSGVIGYESWSEVSARFQEQWIRGRHAQRDRAREQEGGPNFYVVRGHRVGHALLDLVGRMVSAGSLTTSKAGKVLGVKAKQVQLLLGRHSGRTTRRLA